MNSANWFFKKQTLTGSYVKVDLNSRMGTLKLKVTPTEGGEDAATYSFQGSVDAGEIAEADGWQTFQYVAVGEIWVKGSGELQIQAWEHAEG